MIEDDAKSRALSIASRTDESAQFRATLELVGMTQSHLAKLVGVSDRAVRKWVSGKSRPSQGAWDVVKSARNAQATIVSFAVEKALSIEGDMGAKPGSIALSYCCSESAFAGSGYGYDFGHGYDSSCSWTMANANSRLVGSELEARGFTVNFVCPKREENKV